MFQAAAPSAVNDMAGLESTPFSAVETGVDVVETLPRPSPSITYTDMKSPVQSSNPIAIPERSDAGHEQDFDAFSSRFESVGKEDSLMVEADPFDPFSAGGSAKGSSGKLPHSFIELKCPNVKSNQIYIYVCISQSIFIKI